MKKYFGYKNTKTNRLLGCDTGGEWVQVSYLRYILLKVFGYITKKETIQ